ncbi:hypothetical protein QL285_080903 [Trifolium repens]|nr:hypothetical protein QL285_080903 [Trifolium repens]
MAGGVRSSILHTTTFPTFLSDELFRLTVVDRQASWILRSVPLRTGVCRFGSRCCSSLVYLALWLFQRCGGSARIQRFLCGLGVAVVSFRWTGGGGWKSWCCGGGIGGLVAGFVFSPFLPARSGFVVCCVMVLMLWCCLLREGVVVLLRDILVGDCFDFG